MSKFIASYFIINKKENQMKFYSNMFKDQWAFYPIPFVYFYLETCEPESHASILKNKICGLYLSFNWLKYTYIIGLHKTLNNVRNFRKIS